MSNARSWLRDLGGGVARIAAVPHPQMVSGLLLANAISYDSWPVPLISAIAKAGSIAQYAPDGSLRQFLKLMFSKGHETDPAAEAAFDAHAPHYDRHGDAEAFVRQAQCSNVDDTKAIASRLPTLGIPARIVWGPHEFQKIEYGERLAADLGAPLRRMTEPSAAGPPILQAPSRADADFLWEQRHPQRSLRNLRA